MVDGPSRGIQPIAPRGVPMQSQPFSFRVLTVVITTAALSLGMASGPAALPAAAGTAVAAAAALQDPTAPAWW